MRTVFLIFSLLIVTSSAAPVVVPKIDHIQRNRVSQQRHDFRAPFYGGVHTVNWGSWFCGAETWQWSASHDVVHNLCDEKMPEINSCCAVHDSCYDNRIGGQERCDKRFCKCLTKAMRQPDLPPTCTELISDSACGLVKTFGGYVYGGKNNDVSRILIAYHPTLNETANKEYNRLYPSCQNFRKPLISCAYNHMVCTLKMLPERRYKQEYSDCRQNLITCLEETSDFLEMRNNKTCSAQLDNALDAIKDDARLSGLPVELHYFQRTTPFKVTTMSTKMMPTASTTSETDETTTETVSLSTDEIPNTEEFSSTDDLTETTTIDSEWYSEENLK